MEKDLIKQTLETILSHLSVPFELEIIEDADINASRFLIKTDTPQLLIGYRGENLAALSHIVKRIIDKSTSSSNNSQQNENRQYFIIDVNDYQLKRISELKNKAHMLAERARYFKNNVEMSPMSPRDRLIVHSLFSNTQDIKTESSGTGANRRVVLKYIPLEEGVV